MFKCYWFDNARTMLCIALEGTWSLQTYYISFSAAVEKIREVAHPVVLLLDMRQCCVAADCLVSASRIATQHNPEQVIWTVLIVPERVIIPFLQGTLQFLLGHDVQLALAHSLEQGVDCARDHLAQDSARRGLRNSPRF